MERHDYFIHVLCNGWDDKRTLPRAKDLTVDEAKAIAKALELQFACDGVVNVSVTSETEALKDLAQYLVWSREAHQAQECLQASPRLPQNDHGFYAIALAARDHLQELQQLRSTKQPEAGQNEESPLLEAFVKDTIESVFIDTSGKEKWGPIYREEGWDRSYGEPTYQVEESLYRDPSGHWTLTSERTHCQAPCSCGLEFEPLDDRQAVGWLERNNYQTEPDKAQKVILHRLGVNLPHRLRRIDELVQM
jgi:hypothetical protein